jgi:hypothetical protein
LASGPTLIFTNQPFSRGEALTVSGLDSRAYEKTKNMRPRRDEGFRESTNLIDLDDFTRHWHVYITGRFDRFDRTKTVTKKLK